MLAPTDAAAELLGRRRDTVEEVAAEQEEIVEDGVGGQRDIAGQRALPGEEGPGREERQGADHDVAVDRDHPPHLGAVEDRGPVQAEPSAEMRRDNGEPGDDADRFRDRRRQRDAGDAEAHSHGEGDAEQDVEDIDADLQERPVAVRPMPISQPSTA